MPSIYWHIAKLWRNYQGGGFGIGYLPDSGGLNDQSSWLIDAFSIMSSFEAKYKKAIGK